MGVGFWAWLFGNPGIGGPRFLGDSRRKPETKGLVYWAFLGQVGWTFAAFWGPFFHLGFLGLGGPPWGGFWVGHPLIIFSLEIVALRRKPCGVIFSKFKGPFSFKPGLNQRRAGLRYFWGLAIKTLLSF